MIIFLLLLSRFLLISLWSSMLKGEKVSVNTDKFKNDFSIINSKDDALTALIHLGYLGYLDERKTAFIPNYEVATAFRLALKQKDYGG